MRVLALAHTAHAKGMAQMEEGLALVAILLIHVALTNTTTALRVEERKSRVDHDPHTAPDILTGTH